MSQMVKIKIKLKTPTERTIRKWVKDEVLEQMGDRSSFTSVDITLKIRSKYPKYFISNSVIAKISRNNIINWSYELGNMYSASLILVDSNYAYLYHYHTNSHDNYIGRDKTTK